MKNDARVACFTRLATTICQTAYWDSLSVLFECTPGQGGTPYHGDVSNCDKFAGSSCIELISTQMIFSLHACLIKKSLSGFSKSLFDVFNLCLKWCKKCRKKKKNKPTNVVHKIPVLPIINSILHERLASFFWPPAAFSTVSHHQYSSHLFPSCRFSQRSPWGSSGEPLPTWDLLVPLTPVSLRLTPVTLWITLRCLQVWIWRRSHILTGSYRWPTCSGLFKNKRKTSRERIKSITTKIIFIQTLAWSLSRSGWLLIVKTFSREIHLMELKSFPELTWKRPRL